MCSLEDSGDFVTAARRSVNTIETLITTLVESEAGEKAAAVDRADDNSEVAREELSGRTEVDKGILKGHIETIVRESDRQEFHITSIVNEIYSKSQASEKVTNDILDCRNSQGVVSQAFRDIRPDFSLRAPAAPPP